MGQSATNYNGAIRNGQRNVRQLFKIVLYGGQKQKRNRLQQVNPTLLGRRNGLEGISTLYHTTNVLQYLEIQNLKVKYCLNAKLKSLKQDGKENAQHKPQL